MNQYGGGVLIFVEGELRCREALQKTDQKTDKPGQNTSKFKIKLQD